jgi:hypothetical protein
MQVNGLTTWIQEPNRLLATIEVTELWLRASQAERDAIVAGWNWGVRWVYPPPLRLACTVGETGSCLQRIRAGLWLTWIEDPEEPREQTIFFCAAYHSCLFAGLDPDQVFNELANTLPAKSGEVLRRFCQRSVADKALSAFALVARTDANGETELAFA